jgi:hypothetical protein
MSPIPARSPASVRYRFHTVFACAGIRRRHKSISRNATSYKTSTHAISSLSSTPSNIGQVRDQRHTQMSALRETVEQRVLVEPIHLDDPVDGRS